MEIYLNIDAGMNKDDNKKLYFLNKSNVKQLYKKNLEDAGYDIASSETVTIYHNSMKVVSTKLFIEIPKGYVGIIKSRSGLAVKNNIEVGAGVIDSLYRGELLIKLMNHSNEDFIIKKGDRIAQLLIIPVYLEEAIEVKELSSTERGENGFGSTGK